MNTELGEFPENLADILSDTLSSTLEGFSTPELFSSPEPGETFDTDCQQSAHVPHGQAEIVFTQHPRTEVTRMVYFDIRFRVVANGQEVTEFAPSSSLRYEDGTPVQSNILDGLFKITNGECRMRLRIRELSKTHRNQRFQIQIEARGPFGAAVGCVFVSCWLVGFVCVRIVKRCSHIRLRRLSEPIKVLSKTSIVQLHMAQQVTGQKRKTSDETLPTAVASDSPFAASPAYVATPAAVATTSDSTCGRRRRLQRLPPYPQRRRRQRILYRRCSR